MKNKIILVIDSLGNQEIENYEEIMPFLTYLKKKSIYFSNMYSQAPYTEAALMAFYTGNNTMSNGGYLLRFKNSKTFFDDFNKKKYRILNYIQPHVYPSSIKRGITDYYYSVAFDFTVLWEYRLKYYSDLYSIHEINEKDLKICIDLLEDNFKEAIEFSNKMLYKDKSVELIYDNIGLSFEEIKKYNSIVVNQFAVFNNDRNSYIKELLRVGKEHILFNLSRFEQIRKIKDNKIISEIESVYKKTFRKIRYLNIIHNHILTRKNLACLKSVIKERNMKKLLKFLLSLLDKKIDIDLNKRINSNLDSFKNAPSISKHFNHFIEWQRGIKENYLAYIHVDDIHNPEVFFSYDSENLDVIVKEKQLIEKTLQLIPKNYEGSISYLLSLAYIDDKLKNFFCQLEAENILENTDIYITGDHGFSFSYRYSRPTFVTNFYLENYKVPFFYFSKSIKNKIIDNDISNSIISKIILDDKDEVRRCLGDDTVFMEYMGGGCPDYFRKPVQIGLKINNYFYTFEASYKKEFKDLVMVSAYNLEKDPNQYHNIKNILNDNKVLAIDLVEKHFEKLFKNLKGNVY